MIELLENLELMEPLSNPNAVFTIFAPTDEAFLLLEDDLSECFQAPEGSQALESILRYHVTSGEILAGDLSDDQSITMIEDGQSIDINIDDVDSIVINENARIVSSNLMYPNGVVHKIDQVLFPSSA